MLDYLNISFIQFSVNFNFLDANTSFFKMTGSKRESLIGKNIKTIIGSEDTELVKTLMFPKFDKGEEFVQYEFYVYSIAKQKKIPCLFHASPSRDKKGQITSINVLLMDLTTQKKIQTDLENEKRILETVLFGIRDVVSVFDIKGTYIFGSPNSAKIHAKQKQSLLPLDSAGPVDLTLTIDQKKKQFRGEVRGIKDAKGNLFAYAETLTDITNNLQLKEKEQELYHIRQQLKINKLKSEMIGNSKAMEPVFHSILRCAEVDSSVLINGETGVGKEVAAREIHCQSPRKDKPFVVVNCGALPKNLLESELFGHIKGAFTGAINNRHGLFREAHGGTLFLDEIGDLDRPFQVKLLRALQEKEIRPVGGDRNHPIDVRIICATNQNLKTMVKQGTFRRDLYYRIAVIPLLIPPLRDRPDDIIRLVEHFIKKHQKKNQQKLKKINGITAQILCNHNWPGNIRELENSIEHALAMVQGQIITPEYIPMLDSDLSPNKDSLRDTKLDNPFWINKIQQQTLEKQSIVEALERYNGNQTHAACYLGISRVTLWRKKVLYDIDIK